MLALLRWQGLWRCLLVLEVVVVLYLALSPRPPQSLDLGWDKLNHLAAFACMTVSAALGWGAVWRWWVTGLIAFGGLIEILQSFTPNRSAEWADWMTDGVGIAIGVLVWRLLMRVVARLVKTDVMGP
jgi:VanZ family protein